MESRPFDLTSFSLSEEVSDEIFALQSIFGDDSIKPLQTSRPPSFHGHDHQLASTPNSTVRLELLTNLPQPHDETSFRISISIPPSYPERSPPQLQLLDKYIGDLATDSALFGEVLRTYFELGPDERQGVETSSEESGVPWTEGMIAIFEGVENVRERVGRWYTRRIDELQTGELMRELEKEENRKDNPIEGQKKAPGVTEYTSAQHAPRLPDGVEIVTSEPITDRKSVFVGHCARITDPSQVQAILDYLLSDRKIAKATHNILAWRCTTPNGVLHQDNDDDGETAAGARVAHLLHLLGFNNVMVVVTRWYGGIQLGADRFKHINQAARDAMSLGGLLQDQQNSKGSTNPAKKR